MCDVAPVSTIQVTSAPSDWASEATKHASVVLPADSLAGVYAVAVRAPRSANDIVQLSGLLLQAGVRQMVAAAVVAFARGRRV